jgi:hypothetical protein
VGNLLTETLKKKIRATAMIDVLQQVAQGKIKGGSVRDRVAAASALIDKVIPNMRHIEVDTTMRAVTIMCGAGADEAADEEIKRLGVKSQLTSTGNA